jgi:hypothetical protein
MISGSKTPALVSDDELCYSTGELATLNDISVMNISCIHVTAIEECCQALGLSVALIPPLLELPLLTALTTAVEHNHLKQQ